MKTRIEWIDSLKGIGILLVILGHTTFPFKDYVFWIHMPLFFSLIGLTCNPDKNFKNFVLSRFNSLIFPFLTFGILFISLNHIGDFSTWLREIVKFFVYGGVKSSGFVGAYWFLPVLFLSELIFYFIVNNIYIYIY